ncbi:hypothetical protein Pcinc_019599 [Petrolisthes cinctipes]|uniref:Uncharacterized protein n=1 Tax=Petrolisthes cinctipes TaxID=88211 RepID=A0AAE1FJW2_PETCI|nr:hypothetical protein Pcinc_019599 [Petrolisthes cinctipes]
MPSDTGSGLALNGKWVITCRWNTLVFEAYGSGRGGPQMVCSEGEVTGSVSEHCMFELLPTPTLPGVTTSLEETRVTMETPSRPPPPIHLLTHHNNTYNILMPPG